MTINNTQLFKEIGVWDCPCRPYLRKETYCKNCEKAIMKELNEYGFSRIEGDKR